VFDFLKWTDAQIAAAQRFPADRGTKLTTGLWMNLSDFKPAQQESKLLLQPVSSLDDWKQMTDLRAEIEARFGDFSAEEIREMVSQIERCQNKLNATWYLARLRSSLKLVGEVGLVRFACGNEWVGRLQDVDIAPSAQGQGLGNDLIWSTLAMAQASGLSAICLKADTSSWQEEWYVRRGFRRLGTWKS
jgi:predicted N-acetyltransferase YhbS